MGRLNINHLILPISLWVASCSDIPRLFDEKKKNTRASESSSFVPTQIVNGVVTASIAADSTGVQRIQVEKTSLGGAAVEFPPGALAVTTDINIEEATSLATPGQASELGISQEFGQKGPAVLVSPSEPQDAVTPFTIAIPISSPTGLVQNDDNLAVLYRVKSEATQTMSSGIIPRSQLTVVDRNVSFPTSRFGSYQAVYLAAPVESAVEVPTTLPPQSHAVAASLPPLQVASCTPFFVKAGDTVTISGSNIRSSLTLAWNSTKIEVTVESDGSASFVAPSEGKAGLSTIVIEQDGISTTASMFYSGSDAYPMMSVGPTEVCEGVKFFDQSGVLQTGSKTCQANSVCTTDGQVGCITTNSFKAADMNQVASSNIKTGTTIAGVGGSIIPESHNTCSADGAIGCVTTASYKSADMAAAVAGNVKSGVTIAGVTGSYSGTNNNCVSDGEATCVVDGSTFKAAKLSNFTASDIKAGVSIAGVTGSATLESHSNCAADGGTGCVATATYAAALTTALATKVVFGNTVAGVAGNVTLPAVGDVESGVNYGVNGAGSTGTFAVPAQANVASGINYGAGGTEFVGSAGIEAHTDCAADGGTGCVATATYTAALTTGLAAKVVSGNTVAGVPGSAIAESHSSCTAANQSGCVATTTYKTMDLATAGAGTGLTNANFNTTIKTAGNFEFWDAAGAKHTVAGDTDLAAANIASTIDIFGTTGSATLESHNSCTADNQTGCITTATYKSADTGAIATSDLKSGKTIAGIAGALANCALDGEAGCVVVGPAFKAADTSVAVAGNIKSGVTIAGVTGQYPSVTYTLSGASATTDLTSMAATTAAGSYEFWDSAGARYTGTISDASSITPGTSDQTFNASLYRQFTVSGDADLVAAKIKNGVNLFGVSGDYPSASNPLTGADATADLDLATFDAKIKSASSFEWFDAYGNRWANTGDAEIAAANIISGVTIFGTSGSIGSCVGDGLIGCVTTPQYKSADTNAYSTWDIRKGKTVGGIAGDIVFYKNMIGSYDNVTSPAVAGNDVWDTVDDYNNNGAFPTIAPSGWDQATGANWVMDPANDVGGGGGTASDNLCSGTEACVFKDQITGLMWAKDNATTYTWQNAITQCENLSFGGYTDWRLPTQKELMQAYTDGIWSQKATNRLSLAAATYWSSSTVSYNTTSAWVVGLQEGNTTNSAKSTVYRAVCVR